MPKIVSLLIIAFFMISLTSAGDGSYGEAKKGECVQLTQGYANSTYTNISMFIYPDKTVEFVDIPMEVHGTDYNYSYCNTTQLGRHDIHLCTDVDGIRTCVEYDIYVSPSGRERITDGEGTTLAIAIIVMIIIASAFFFLGHKADNLAYKIMLMGIAGILLIAILLFSLVILSQILGGFNEIVEGYSTFWMVVKILVGIFVTLLVIFVVWISYKYWMFRRGFL